MKILNVEDQAPSFQALDQNNKIHNLVDYFGQWLLLYFYPKDNTPGCTKEACAIRDSYDDFKKIKAQVLGVSTDSIKSHINFATKLNLPFPILSDPDKKISKAYNSLGLNRRKSYLINPEGKIARIYLKVMPEDHAKEVLSDLSILST